jgi:hypothetical protein
MDEKKMKKIEDAIYKEMSKKDLSEIEKFIKDIEEKV